MPGSRSIVGRATMRAFRGVALFAALVIACAVLVLSYPAPRAVAINEVDADSLPAPEASGSDAHVVTLDGEGQKKGGIETVSPQAVAYRDQVRAYGTVLALDRLTALYNQAIAANAQLQAVKVKLAASQVANDRAKNLLKVFSTAQVQAETAEATVKIDAASVESAQAQMDILRNTAVQDWGPKLGAAIVTRGSLAEALVLRKSVLVQLSLKPGTFTTPPRRIKLTFGGTEGVEADFVSDATQVDPKIQNVGFWYAAPATLGLVPGASILAYLPKGETRPGVGIPPSAVVWQAGKAWLFVREGSNRFERRAIDAAAAPMADGGFVVPASSMPGDKRIVVAGAQILLSEETRSQMPSQEDDN